MSPSQVLVSGRTYNIAHAFGPSRVIIDYEGVFVFVDQNSDGTWDLSGIPASENEKPFLVALVGPDKLIVTVTPPEE